MSFTPQFLDELKSRLGDCQSLDALTSLLAWDQRTLMPPAGFQHRADHLSLLQRLSHGTLIDPEVGRLLDELESRDLDPDSWDSALVRVARRDYKKAVQVPVELSTEMARAAAESAPGWLEAKATSNFDLFLPLMERNVEVRRRDIRMSPPRQVRQSGSTSSGSRGATASTTRRSWPARVEGASVASGRWEKATSPTASP